jgi:ABC-2 type transport system permease protein
LTLLTLLLVIVSNRLLEIHGPMVWISLFLSLLITWTTVAMALGFGTYFVDFKSENRAAALGPGSILFLFCAVLYQLAIIAVGVFPIYRLIRGWIRTSVISWETAAVLGVWAVVAVIVSACIAVFICRRSLNALKG